MFSAGYYLWWTANTEEGKKSVEQIQAENEKFQKAHTYEVHNLKEYVVTETETNSMGGVIRTNHRFVYSFECNGKIYTDFDPSFYNRSVELGEQSILVVSRSGEEKLIISREDYANR